MAQVSWLINLIIPGAGLIRSRREWLGASLGLFFGACGNLAVAGAFIAPAAIPAWLTWLSASLAALAWFLSQVLLVRQRAFQRQCDENLRDLLRETKTALDGGDVTAALANLKRAAHLDAENVEMHVLWARLYTHEGDREGARRMWQRVLKYDRRRVHEQEARQAIGAARE